MKRGQGRWSPPTRGPPPRAQSQKGPTPLSWPSLCCSSAGSSHFVLSASSSFFLSPGRDLVSARGFWCHGGTCREILRVEVPSELPAQIPHHIKSRLAFLTGPLRRTFRRSCEPILPVTLRQEFVFDQSVHLV